MIEIKLTLDATPALIGAVRDLAGAIHAAANNAQPVPAREPCGQLTPQAIHAEPREVVEKDGTAEDAQNLPSEDAVEAERTETPENVGAPKKRKSREKKRPSENKAQVAPAIGDNSSPVGEAETERAAAEETTAPETTPEIAPETTPEIAPEIAPETTPCFVHLDGTDPLAGKGQTGEILATLTREAIGDLDALGVDRSEANRRIRDYCARKGIKFPTFPALLQAVGYAEAIAICTGA